MDTKYMGHNYSTSTDLWNWRSDKKSLHTAALVFLIWHKNLQAQKMKQESKHRNWSTGLCNLWTLHGLTYILFWSYREKQQEERMMVNFLLWKEEHSSSVLGDCCPNTIKSYQREKANKHSTWNKAVNYGSEASFLI